MNAVDHLIAGLDLLLVFATVLLLCVLGIQYDADRGLGSTASAVPVSVARVDPNLSPDHLPGRLHAIILEKNYVAIVKVSKRSLDYQRYPSVKNLIDEQALDRDSAYIIYEKEETADLASLIRHAANHSVQISIATETP